MRKKQTIGSIMLLMTSIIWGCAFVAQKVGMDYIGPFSFCGFRFLFSASFLMSAVENLFLFFCSYYVPFFVFIKNYLCFKWKN